MKPLTAVATFIMAELLANVDKGDLYSHAQDFKQRSGELTAKQKARIDEVLADFTAKIASTLKAAGAEVDADDAPTSAGTASDTITLDPDSPAYTETDQGLVDVSLSDLQQAFGNNPPSVSIGVINITVR